MSSTQESPIYDPNSSKSAQTITSSLPQTIAAMGNTEENQSINNLRPDIDADLERISFLPIVCSNCGVEGQARMLLTEIPYFKTIALMSFACTECGLIVNDIQPCTELAPTAVRLTLHVRAHTEHTSRDLNRQIIKSETARILLPQIDFEIPPNASGRGDINTVEGVLRNIIDSLSVDQPNRRLVNEDIYNKIETIIERVKSWASGEQDFDFVLDDLAGNSYIENPIAPHKDPRVDILHYERTPEQTAELGFATDNVTSKTNENDSATSKVGVMSVDASIQSRVVDTYFNVADRSAIMEGVCPSCSAECETRMAITELPHFKEIILMVTLCNNCGYKDSEVKPGGKVSEKATKISLKVDNLDDMKRDLMKSDTSSVVIPELELELGSGTLGGKYTTVEGLLTDIREQLTQTNAFMLGDSSDPTQNSHFKAFLQRLEDCIAMKMTFTLVIDDPLGNVYVYGESHEFENGKILIERYERTFEQNEELGLNDINVDHYLSPEDEAELKKEMEREKLEDEARQKEEEVIQQIEMERKKEYNVGTKVGGLIRPEDYEESHLDQVTKHIHKS